MTLFWISVAGLTLLALGFLLVPLWQEQKISGRNTLSGPLTALAVVPVSLGLYLYTTTYDPEFASARNNEEVALLEQLAARLGQNPDDVQGWVLLGRSYLELGDYGRARAALEEAWRRTAMPDDALKLAYAESMLFTEPQTAQTIAGDLIEQVLANAPNNQRALWWGGLIAMEREQPAVAAQRWTALLATNPPPEIADLLRTQLVGLASGSTPGRVAATEPVGPVIDLEIDVADGLSLDNLGTNAFVYIFARSPAGGPPIAALQRPVSALPGRFALSDADAMIAGRTLAGQDTVTVVARISVTGQPTEQPGDLYGEVQVDPASGESVRLTIDRTVPQA